MCATARHKPTAEEEKNSFERSPRSVKFSSSLIGLAGSCGKAAPLRQDQRDGESDAAASSKARPICRRIKLE